jgi:hypothetical protein
MREQSRLSVQKNLASIIWVLLLITVHARHRTFDDDNPEVRAANEAIFAKTQAAAGPAPSDVQAASKMVDPAARHYLGESFEKLSDGGKLNHLLSLVPFLYSKIDDLSSKHEVGVSHEVV